MSKCYSITGPAAAGTGPQTAANVIASTSIRPMVNEIAVGISTTPADQTYQACISRNTGVGTAGSSPTPAALDPGDVACVSTAGITHSGEPTSPTDMLMFYLNQRASWRWVAQDGREVLAPATANNNVSIRMKLASASSTLQATLIFRE